jgi:hypothetical protein
LSFEVRPSGRPPFPLFFYTTPAEAAPPFVGFQRVEFDIQLDGFTDVVSSLLARAKTSGLPTLPKIRERLGSLMTDSSSKNRRREPAHIPLIN